MPLISFAETPQELYLKHCSSCHHPERYGVSAPPLFKETVGSKNNNEIKETILNGLPATNMLPFKEILKASEVDAIISYIKTPIEKPKWDRNDILNSKIIPQDLQPPTSSLQPKDIDLSNLFMIVEGGTGIVHFMDGDTFNIIDKIKVGAMHGGPKFDYNFNFSYILSRDGWLVQYNLKNLKEVARIRAGINSRNLAVSNDGRLIAVANLLPQNMVFIDAEKMEPVFMVDVDTRIGAIYTLKERGLFVAALREKPEVWLIDYNNNFNTEKIMIDQPFSDFFIEPTEQYLIGAARNGEHLTVFDMKERKVIKNFEISGMPHLASAALWKDGGKTFAAFPHIKSPTMTIIELYKWDIIAKINLKGPGYFARTHESIPYIWVDTNTDTMQLIDKKDFTVVKEVIPEKGRFAMHTEFTKDGRFALVSIREKGGAVFIYDIERMEVIKKLPFDKPIGKYNATNKTH
ncbi:MAG: c-type cytochrome [Deltaproteobacteria bacterium]|nr:c-type cytochrome [Deltaproteobacteria bacterium]